MSFLVFLLVLSFTLVRTQSTNSCTNQYTCNECIRTKGCSWCLKFKSGSDDSSRCLPSLSILNYCDKNFIENPINSYRITESKSLTQGRATKAEKIVQVFPQRINMTLRLNQPQKITLTYLRAEDYPVDLYYLMDLSYSMNIHKEKLSTLGTKIAAVMKRITKDFRLGFGSFVDKITLPYANTSPKLLKKVCRNCRTGPYGFKNHMKLDTDAKKFEEEVKKAPISGNDDVPEGGFDALMQALVCHEEIGWRNQTRRLIVFSTDAGYHLAGDGKLGGIVKPNDGECHMKNHEYTHSLIQDYPSVAHINAKVKENAVNLLFAVTQNLKQTYTELAQHIEGSYTSYLEQDTSNIVTLIEDQYREISSTVELKDNSDESVHVEYYSKCLDNYRSRTNKCKKIKTGDKVEFDIEITATSCDTPHQSIKIYPVGIDESLIIDIDLICTCDCEKSNHKDYQVNSASCRNHGTLKCGICECNPGFSGRLCECNDGSTTTNATDTSCENVSCNDHGSCICGQCECNNAPKGEGKYFGKNCECDNFHCPRSNGLFCGGPKHGECGCHGICDCKKGWGGPACSCLLSNETCKAPDETNLCSGHGECICGKCICEKTEETRRFGKFCEKCSTCVGQCKAYKDCVQCLVYEMGPLSQEAGVCSSNCSNIIISEKVEELGEAKPEVEQYCEFYDENKCRFTFIYNDRDENKVIVRALQKPVCSEVVLPFNVIISIVGTILLVGLATLLLWKCIATCQDRREFARFEEERKNACWESGQNPIYRQATSTFKNPTYVETKHVAVL